MLASIESQHNLSHLLIPSVMALEKLHAKHVLPGFADRTLEEQEIEAATTDITKVFFISF